MKIEVDVDEYDAKEGLSISLDPEAVMLTTSAGRQFVIRANRAALVRLASHLLTLAQANVPAGAHIHYDDLNFLQEHSQEMLIELI